MIAQARRARPHADDLLASGFPVLQTKLAFPPSRAGILARPGLVDRLTASTEVPIVAVLAPAGYGKSTVLAQWARSDPRRFAWLSIDARDNDPSVLLAYIATALGGARSLGPEVAETLASPGPSVWTSAVPRLGAALAAARRPFVLVLDDIDALSDPEPTDVIVALASHLPAGSQFALAGRTAGRLPILRLLAGGLGLVIDSRDLALADEEAGAVLKASGVELPAAEVASLNRSMEGWPAGIYLTALSIRSHAANGEAAIHASPLTDRLVEDYIRAELLGRLGPDDMAFLLEASALERLSAPLCDSVMERSDSAIRLDSLERSNLMLQPLDGSRQWYRYHHLLREHLLDELRRRDGTRVGEIQARAAAWHAEQGEEELALDYALAGGNLELVARLLPQLAQRAANSGRIDTVRRWFEILKRVPGWQRYPALAVVGAVTLSLTDDAAGAEHWARRVLDAQPVDETDPETIAMLAFGRAFLSRGGMDMMKRDAEAATAGLPEDHSWRPLAEVTLGVAELALGNASASDAAFGRAIEIARLIRTPHTAAATALAYRALIAIGRGAWDAARSYVDEARDELEAGRVGELAAAAIVDAISARVAVHDGGVERARLDIAHTQRLRPLLTAALPWASARVRLDLAHVHLALADAPGARTLLVEVRDIVVRRPDLGAMADELADLQARVARVRGEVVGASTLTTAELRLLPLLTTHLSFREIGERLFVTHNTVKTQAISIYRKLDATSRSEAIDRAVQVGLLESVTPTQRFIPQG